MKKFIAAIAASSAALAASPAFAQDDSVFAGPYAGVSVGASSLDATFVDGDEDFSYGIAHQTKAGFVYGVTAGYNAAVGTNAIVGVEADFNGNTTRVRHDLTGYDALLLQSNPWFATVRARAGLTVGNALVYATGGIAIVRNNNEVFYDNASCADAEEVCKASTDLGLAVGAGAEIALSRRVGVKAEFLHIDSGTQKYGEGTDSVSFTNKQNIARVGYNFRF